MSTNLYEVLGVTKDATPEQIRKAYKKQALKTHPDKLHPSLSEEEKASAAEKFRQISHACEILTDQERRKEYDTHGVWPPPESESDDDFDTFFSDAPGFTHTFSHRSHGFSSPFFTSHRHHPRSRPVFAFRDPFEFFDTFFRDFEDIFATSMHTSTPFNHIGASFSHRPRNFFDDPFFGPSPGFPLTASPFTPGMLPSPFARGFGNNGELRGHRIQTQSYVSQTVNGVTQSTHTRRDSDGNEHIIRKLPDGREVYTINGVEQSPRGTIQQTSHDTRQIPSVEPRRHSTLPSYSQAQSTPRYQRDFHPHSQVHRTTYTPAAQEFDTSPPYPGNRSSFRTHTQTADRRANGNPGGSTQYGERRRRRSQRTSEYA
ncbi:hypothetical protein D9756_002431 [Leucocoprinus leucothites]|uniref:J domain-containing protein n=1 Tax=Leucocoprinus leucothites TaxID=201217 RepID=A0A8H5LMD8_9AGAR|nr:hypothetical protein D9756_002431 [Leucoagaricus leucothites]